MPHRNTIRHFTENAIYHIYNRGVDKRNVFQDDRDYFRFLEAMELMNDERDGLMIEWRDEKRKNPKKPFHSFLKETFRKFLKVSPGLIKSYRSWHRIDWFPANLRKKTPSLNCHTIQAWAVPKLR